MRYDDLRPSSSSPPPAAANDDGRVDDLKSGMLVYAVWCTGEGEWEESDDYYGRWCPGYVVGKGGDGLLVSYVLNAAGSHVCRRGDREACDKVGCQWVEIGEEMVVGAEEYVLRRK